jgi:hypothetical protein
VRVLENRALRRGSNRRLQVANCMMGSFIISTPTIIRAIKSRRMRWASNVERMGEMRNAYEILVGKPKEKKSLGNLGAVILQPFSRYILYIGYIIGCEDVDWIKVDQLRVYGGFL